MQLFYAEKIQSQQMHYHFDKEESKHIVRVLRKQINDILFITNGKGFLFEAKITFANEKKCEVELINEQFHPQKPFHIHLAVAPTKMNDRYEWFLEKATEIGIDEITPIICAHSERKVIKPERFEKIILAALKQSNQFYLPKLNPAQTFDEFISQKHDESENFIAHCDDDHKIPLKNNFTPNSSYTLLIGPEGDFSPQEIEKALTKNFKPVTLGSTRLRTETAAIVACHSFVYGNENA